MATEETEEHQLTTIGKIAVGLVETFSPEYFKLLLEYAKGVENDGVFMQLTHIINSIETKAPLSELDITSLAFIILLSERTEPEEPRLDA